MKPTPKIEENRDQRIKKKPLRGGKPPLNYINEQFFDDTNDKTSSLYMGVHGATM